MQTMTEDQRNVALSNSTIAYIFDTDLFFVRQEGETFTANWLSPDADAVVVRLGEFEEMIQAHARIASQFLIDHNSGGGVVISLN